MQMRFFSRAFLILLVFSFASSVSFAGEPTEEIKRITEKIIDIITDPSLQGDEKKEEKVMRIRNSVDERFDGEEMAKRTLARHWSKRKDHEKKEFTELFEKFLEKTYLDRVLSYSGEKISYGSENIDDDYASVDVKILSKEKVEIPLIYKLKKKGTNWHVYDISIEGVSLINNYRTQFNSIIMRKSYEKLVEMLREKVEKG